MTRATSMKRRCSASPQRASRCPDLPARSANQQWGCPAPPKRRALLREEGEPANPTHKPNHQHHPSEETQAEVDADCTKRNRICTHVDNASDKAGTEAVDPDCVTLQSTRNDGDGDRTTTGPDKGLLSTPPMPLPVPLSTDTVSTPPPPPPQPQPPPQQQQQQEDAVERVESPPLLRIISCHSLAPPVGHSPCPSPSHILPCPSPRGWPSLSRPSTPSSGRSSCPSTPSSSRPATPATPATPAQVTRVVASSRVSFSGTVLSEPAAPGSFFDLLAAAASQSTVGPRRAQSTPDAHPDRATHRGPAQNVAGVPGQCPLCRRPLSDTCICKHRDLLRRGPASPSTSQVKLKSEVPPTNPSAKSPVSNSKSPTCLSHCEQQGGSSHTVTTSSRADIIAEAPSPNATSIKPANSPEVPLHNAAAKGTTDTALPAVTLAPQSKSTSDASAYPHNVASTSGDSPTTPACGSPSPGAQAKKATPIQVPNPMSFGGWFRNLEKFVLRATSIQQHTGGAGGKVISQQAARTPPRAPGIGPANNVKHTATGPQMRPMTASQAAQAAAQGKTVRDLLDKQRSGESTPSGKVLMSSSRLLQPGGHMIQRGGALVARAPGSGTAIRSALPSGKSVIDLTDDDDRRAAPPTPGRVVRGPAPTGGAVRGPAPPGGATRPGPVLMQQVSNAGGPVIVQQVMTSQAVRPPPGTAYVYTTRPGPLSMQAAPGASLVRAAVASAAPPALRPASQTVTVARMPGPASLTRPPPPLRSAPNASAQVKHPAPLPAQPENQSAQPKGPPPKPGLKISRVQSGIVLSWNMTVSDSAAAIASYQLFAYQETSAAPATSLWKKVGDVKALPLPMACTLTQFQEGNKYHFAVRAVDVHSRVGPFSEPSSIALTVINVS